MHSVKHLRSARRLLTTIEQLTREQPGYRPTVRELAVLAKMSVSGAREALETLHESYGYVEIADAGSCIASRTIRLIPQTY